MMLLPKCMLRWSKLLLSMHQLKLKRMLHLSQLWILKSLTQPQSSQRLLMSYKHLSRMIQMLDFTIPIQSSKSRWNILNLSLLSLRLMLPLSWLIMILQNSERKFQNTNTPMKSARSLKVVKFPKFHLINHNQHPRNWKRNRDTLRLLILKKSIGQLIRTCGRLSQSKS